MEEFLPHMDCSGMSTKIPNNAHFDKHTWFWTNNIAWKLHQTIQRRIFYCNQILVGVI